MVAVRTWGNHPATGDVTAEARNPETPTATKGIKPITIQTLEIAAHQLHVDDVLIAPTPDLLSGRVVSCRLQGAPPHVSIALADATSRVEYPTLTVLRVKRRTL